MKLTIILSEEIKQTLMQRSTECGKDIKTLVEEMVESYAERAMLDEILAPLHRSVEESGITKQELDALIESERQAVWEEKYGKRL